MINKAFNKGLLVLLYVVFCCNTLQAQESRKIRGDSSSWDIANNQMKYFGNAVLTYQNLVIKGDELVAKSDSIDKQEIIIVTGQPASFQDVDPEQNLSTNLRAYKIQYHSANNTINASQQVHIKQTNERQETINIEGEELSLKQEKNYRLSVSGSPLHITILQADQSSIDAQAEQLFYDKKTEQFELIGSVVVKSERETMKANRVIYNMKTQILQVPKSDKGQVEIIQSKPKD